MHVTLGFDEDGVKGRKLRELLSELGGEDVAGSSEDDDEDAGGGEEEDRAVLGALDKVSDPLEVLEDQELADAARERDMRRSVELTATEHVQAEFPAEEAQQCVEQQVRSALWVEPCSCPCSGWDPVLV